MLRPWVSDRQGPGANLAVGARSPRNHPCGPICASASPAGAQLCFAPSAFLPGGSSAWALRNLDHFALGRYIPAATLLCFCPWGVLSEPYWPSTRSIWPLTGADGRFFGPPADDLGRPLRTRDHLRCRRQTGAIGATSGALPRQGHDQARLAGAERGGDLRGRGHESGRRRGHCRAPQWPSQGA